MWPEAITHSFDIGGVGIDVMSRKVIMPSFCIKRILLLHLFDNVATKCL